MVTYSIISCVNDFIKFDTLVKPSFGQLLSNEFIVLDNTKNIYTLTQAYNLGKVQAKGDYLIFVHQDVKLGETLEIFANGIQKIFSDKTVGLIGFAGSKTAGGTSWGSFGPNYGKVKHCPGEHILSWNKVNFIEQVVVVDGLCMIMPRNVANIITFDESLCYFHHYDLDISLTIHQLGYKVVVFDYWMLHYCGGHGPKFSESAGLFIKKWQNKFPIKIT